MSPSIWEILGVTSLPTTFFFYAWIFGLAGWVVCHLAIEKYWTEKAGWAKRLNQIKQGFEAAARVYLILYLYMLGLITGGMGGLAVMVAAVLLTLQSILNMRNFLLVSMAVLMLIVYVAALIGIYGAI